MKALFVGLGWITLVTLLAVHVGAIFDVNIFDHAPWLILVLVPGIFLPFAAFVTELPNALGFRLRPTSTGRWSIEGARITFTRLLGLFPAWARWVIAACYIYAGILFASLSFGEQGQAAIRDGRYVLQLKGSLVRELTRGEYEHLHARFALVFCGFITVFCVIPLLYFLVGGPEGWKRQPALDMKRHP